MVSKIPGGTFIMDNEGLEFPDIWEVEDLYVSRLEEGSNKDDSSPKLDETLHSELYGSISPEEVKLCISEIERDTSPGPDSITLADLKILTSHKIAAILNKLWGHSIPDSAKECRTTLIPKSVEELNNPSNWRPITIGNLFIRLYAKIWNKRLRSNIKLDIRQEGFVPVDRCFENVKILPQLIKHQRLKKKEYNIVFTDLAMVSDTVSHKSIAKGLRCKGVPEQVNSDILEMYSNSNTSITVRGKTTRRISINAGVKQGCPLSRLLFNLILDELIEKLKGLGIGIKLMISLYQL